MNTQPKRMREQVLDRFKDPASMRWVPLSALKATEHLSCIDGRHDNCVIAAPGGDMGEFVLLMTAVENVTGNTLSEEQIAAALDHIMRWHLRFYMHTDEHGLRELSNDLSQDPAFPDNLTKTQTLNLVMHPHFDQREPLCRHLLDPKHVGCGFLNLMLRQPETFGVRLELVQASIRAFYNQLWSGSTAPLLEVLWGNHGEEAVVSVEVEGDDQDDSTYVPSVCECEDGPSQMFVDHRAARSYLRGENLRLMANHAIVDPAIDEAAVVEYCEELGKVQMAAVLNALAPDLPRYEVLFSDDSHIPKITRLS